MGAAAMGDPGDGVGVPNLEAIELLLSKGANPDLSDEDANPTIPATPLNLVCYHLRQATAAGAEGDDLETYEAVIALLLAHGAAPEGCGPLRLARPLHYVVGYSFAATTALLEAGADPNGRMYGVPGDLRTAGLTVDNTPVVVGFLQHKKIQPLKRLTARAWLHNSSKTLHS